MTAPTDSDVCGRCDGTNIEAEPFSGSKEAGTYIDKCLCGAWRYRTTHFDSSETRGIWHDGLHIPPPVL